MKILNRDVPEKLASKLILDIKNKQQLKNINEDFVKDLLVKELEKSSKTLDFLLKHELKNLDRSEKYKDIVKHVRLILHKAYGIFLTKESKKSTEYMQDLAKSIYKVDSPLKTSEEHREILNTHVSTKERLDIYPKLYWKIWTITGKPRKIIDLASGLNPFSFPWMGLNNVDYLATELNKEDCNLLNEYFALAKRFQMFGLAIQLNLQDVLKKPELLKGLPQSDICFLFKVLDSIELTNSHKISEIVVSSVPAKWVIASFPIKTISKKSMSSTRHVWIEKMCERLKYKFRRFLLGNESFYVIDKNIANLN